MYQSGDIQVATVPTESDWLQDWRGGKPVNVAAPVAYLPYVTDQFVIGGPEQVKAMIADLQAALARMEKGA